MILKLQVAKTVVFLQPWFRKRQERRSRPCETRIGTRWAESEKRPWWRHNV